LRGPIIQTGRLLDPGAFVFVGAQHAAPHLGKIDFYSRRDNSKAAAFLIRAHLFL
jgi:hypothetical protein